MRLDDLVRTSNAVAATSGRHAKVATLAELLGRLSPDDARIAVPFLTGGLRQGRIGVGASAIREAATGVAAAASPTLELADVDAAFAEMSVVKGAGSAARRVQRLRGVFERSTVPERDFLVRLLFGELRQGAVEGVLADAVSRAANVPLAKIRRAAMVTGSLTTAACAALVSGVSGLESMDVALFAPLQPMLADSSESVEEALAETDGASVEYKLDGGRIQVHRDGEDVRIYSRGLHDVTASLPDVVRAVRALPVPRLILDGEALALRPDGTPQPFQVTMRQFGRTAELKGMEQVVPLTPFFFDCLYVDGQSLLDDPLSRRIAVLDDVVPASLRVPRRVGAGAVEAASFAAAAERDGHEGVVVKSLQSTYEAGRRGRAWIKVKRARTLDLVVLAAEWGSGRRAGSLSNLHLGARDDERGGFVMLGKTFKGLTDALLVWQTQQLLAREIGRDGPAVFVRPELVVEIAFNEIQESPHYPGRLALRFARVKRYRSDKSAAQADAYSDVRRLFTQITGLDAPPR